MDICEFDYDLPDRLIAHFPPARRTESRLLALDRRTGKIRDHQFPELLDYLEPGDLLVFNDTRVIPARLYGIKSTGGKVELLVERIVSDQEGWAHIRASKSPKPGTSLIIEGGGQLEVTGRQDDLFRIRHTGEGTLLDLLKAVGHIPLPPYIERADEAIDQERYQTVYGTREGAVAAPTAGLHFDQALMDALTQRQVQTGFVTLHVGAGTFQPVRVQNIHEHKMHSEWVDVSGEVCQKIRETKASGGRVIAVGTTSVRSLETANGEPFQGETDIFIYPGYTFNTVDAIITNFHLPKSTLLMLVSAFAGKEQIFNAYQHAIHQSYRFFSYGDAMLIY